MAADSPNPSPPQDAKHPQGLESTLDSPQERNAALDMALDYRGDVTVHTTDGQVIQGYVFDRRANAPNPSIRLLVTNAGRMDILEKNISRLIFSGRDTAAGKSWENWVKKYQEKRARGMPANLEPDPLD